GSVTLAAYVCAPQPAPSGLVEALKEFMRSAPPAMRPQRFYLTRRIPRLPSSKLDLGALAALDARTVEGERRHADDAIEESPANGDAIARTVARVWQEVLDAPVRAPEDDFFEAGGDSLAAITFTMEIELALGRDLPLTLINEAPQFAAFCQ